MRSGLVACTGNSYCKFAQANTKGHALALANYLEKKLKLDQPVNIHLTGCPNSCAQHYMGDIGLLARRSGGAEAYHVFVGGGFGANQAVGRQVFSGIPFEELKLTLEKMLQGLSAASRAGETFQRSPSGTTSTRCRPFSRTTNERAASSQTRTLIDELLAEQQRSPRSSVSRASRTQDALPAQELYRDLIPARSPGPGRAIRLLRSTWTPAPAARPV